jgi:hypothetical protein
MSLSSKYVCKICNCIFVKGVFKSEDIPNIYPKLLNPVHGKDKILIAFNIMNNVLALHYSAST